MVLVLSIHQVVCVHGAGYAQPVPSGSDSVSLDVSGAWDRWGLGGLTGE